MAPPGSTTAPASWSWLSHQHKQHKQQHHHHSDRQDRDDKSKSEVIGAESRAVIYGRSGNCAAAHGAEEWAAARAARKREEENESGGAGDTLIDCWAAESDESGAEKTSARFGCWRRQTVAATPISANPNPDPNQSACDSKEEEEAARLGESQFPSPRRRRRSSSPTAAAAAAAAASATSSSSSPSSLSGGCGGSLTRAPPAAREQPQPARRQQRRQRQISAISGSTAINNATNCDRWQQISCLRSSSSTSLANRNSSRSDDDDGAAGKRERQPAPTTPTPTTQSLGSPAAGCYQTSSASNVRGRGYYGNNNSSSRVMEILRKHHQQQQQQQQHKNLKSATDSVQANNNKHFYQQQIPEQQTFLNYPNNTLIVDLIKCHRNIANVWPQTRLDSSLDSLKSICCWPRDRRRFAMRRQKQQQQQQQQQQPQSKGCKRLNFQMPEPLARTNIRLKSDVYDKALCVLTSDIRYQLHLLLYRRIQTIWLLLSTIFCIVIPTVLVANLELLFVLGTFSLWLSLQLLGVFLTRQFRIKLDQMLEKSVAQVNSFFMEHNLMLGVINVGSLTRRAKLNIPMVYFDTSQCREQIESIISITGRRAGERGGDDDDCDGGSSGSSSSSSDSSKSDIINNNNNNSTDGDNFFLDYSKLSESPLNHHNHRNQYQSEASATTTTPTTTTTTKPPNVAIALAQSQMAKKILLKYSQRWISQYDKRKLMFADDNLEPRHLSTGKCLCQFIEEQLTSSSSSSSQQQRQVAKFERCADQSADCKVVIDMGDMKPNEVIRTRQVSKQGSQAPIIPTLSRLVSLRDNNKTTHDDRSQISNGIFNSTTLNNQMISSASSSASVSNVDAESREPSEVDLQSTTRDISLELGGDSIGRSDDLVKRLRLLLELRKNELQGIGGSLFSNINSKTPQFLSSFNDHSTGYTTADSLTIDSSQQDPSSPRTPPPVDKTGKKFFRQRDGLFLLGMIGAKKSQQQQQQQQDQHTCCREQILEIC